MWKHITLQAFFEICLLLFLYIKGPYFIPEDKKEILNSHRELYMCFGTLPGDINYEKNKDYILFGNENSWNKNIFLNLTKIKSDTSLQHICQKYLPINQEEWKNISLFDIFNKYNDLYGSTTHMTFIFNVFVFYTLFNQFNCRIIDDYYNIFSRINKGFMFCLVTFGEMLIQFLIVQYGYGVFHCVKGGLSFNQWTLCIIFSSTTFLFSVFIKMIPIDKCIDHYIGSNGDNNAGPLSNFGIRKGMSVIVSNFLGGDKINDNYVKISKDDETKHLKDNE